MSRRSIILGLVPATFFIVLTSPGCGRDGSSAEGSVSPTAPDSVIAGEGSTFVMPLMQAWISGYQSAHPKKLINYRPIGSGGGIEDFKKGWLAFAASDAPLSDNQLKDLSPTIQVPGTAFGACQK
jgi:phosphate transport system substrate-binding protein